MSRDIFPQPRVLPAPSNLALNPAREGAATASLGSLGQVLTTLMGKNFFLLSNLNLRSLSLKEAPGWPTQAPTCKGPVPLLRHVRDETLGAAATAQQSSWQ